MPLASGSRLGSYEILSLLGSGGMGEVYRARDTKLDRDVAIKVLPELFAADPDPTTGSGSSRTRSRDERLNRFEREAKTLAAFNHPNIAQVHGVIEHPRALVMELVEGEDLAALIARGPIPLDEAISIARQIAEGLEAAHDRGIIHRDLKPANVKLREDGVVKVLDFGLAKALADRTAVAEVVDNSPTFASAPMTEMGVILGTAAYMAPEQAKGKEVDKRADIWAFGCVLYEMLTARRVFSGETSSELLAAVIMTEPELSHLPANVPAGIRRLIQRCLEKDPRQRLRDIGEARIGLSAPAVAEPAPVSHATSSKLASGAWLTAGVLIGAAIIWLLAAGAAIRPAPALPEFSLRQLTELPGPELQPDISPDGRQILFASAASGNHDVYLLRVGGAQPINLTSKSAADDEQATFSPDGERIAFRSGREGGGLFTMGATGESVRRLTTEGFDPAWSPDGKFLAYSTEGVVDPYARNVRAQLWTVEVATGKSNKILEGDAVQPAWSPDGRRIAYWANTGGQRDIWTVDAGGGKPITVTQDAATDWSPEWSSDGASLYFSSDRGGTMNLWRVAIDQRSGSPTGTPQAITNSFTGIGYARFAADERRIAVMAYNRSFELAFAPFDASSGKVGPETAVRSPSLGWCSPSPKGDWLACTSLGAQEDIVLMRPDGSETVRLMDDGWKDRNPTWSADSSRIGFMSTRSGQWELWSVRKDGSDLRQMTDLRSDLSIAVWSPDGKQIASTASTRPPTGLWLFDPSVPATPQTARFFKNPLPQSFSAESWSPDGKLVAGSLLDRAGFPRRIAVWEMATGSVRLLNVPVPSTWSYFATGGWLPDSRRFLAVSDKGLALVDSATGQATPVPVRTGSRYGLLGAGRTLMVERLIYDADVWLMEIRR